MSPKKCKKKTKNKTKLKNFSLEEFKTPFFQLKKCRKKTSFWGEVSAARSLWLCLRWGSDIKHEVYALYKCPSGLGLDVGMVATGGRGSGIRTQNEEWCPAPRNLDGCRTGATCTWSYSRCREGMIRGGCPGSSPRTPERPQRETVGQMFKTTVRRQDWTGHSPGPSPGSGAGNLSNGCISAFHGNQRRPDVTWAEKTEKWCFHVSPDCPPPGRVHRSVQGTISLQTFPGSATGQLL